MHHGVERMELYFCCVCILDHIYLPGIVGLFCVSSQTSINHPHFSSCCIVVN
jgi:hypothetical protein